MAKLILFLVCVGIVLAAAFLPALVRVFDDLRERVHWARLRRRQEGRAGLAVSLPWALGGGVVTGVLGTLAAVWAVGS